jgi:hypothetical protein
VSTYKSSRLDLKIIAKRVGMARVYVWEGYCHPIVSIFILQVQLHSYEESRDGAGGGQVRMAVIRTCMFPIIMKEMYCATRRCPMLRAEYFFCFSFLTFLFLFVFGSQLYLRIWSLIASSERFLLFLCFPFLVFSFSYYH